MITTIPVNQGNKKVVRNILIESGFISATVMYGQTDEELFKKIGIKKSWLPKPTELKKIADSPERDLNCKCLQYDEKTKSYWYLVSDLQRIYAVTIFDKPVTNGYSHVVGGENYHANWHETAKSPRPNWFRRMLNYIFG